MFCKCEEPKTTKVSMLSGNFEVCSKNKGGCGCEIAAPKHYGDNNHTGPTFTAPETRNYVISSSTRWATQVNPVDNRSVDGHDPGSINMNDNGEIAMIPNSVCVNLDLDGTKWEHSYTVPVAGMYNVDGYRTLFDRDDVILFDYMPNGIYRI